MYLFILFCKFSNIASYKVNLRENFANVMVGLNSNSFAVHRSLRNIEGALHRDGNPEEIFVHV